MIRKANYLKDFRCIGGICQDNCCIGWSVEIDRKTFAAYGKFKDPMLKKLIREKIYENEEFYDEKVDFALVELEEDKRCPFLNGENLCRIQAKMGEAHLSNVCATYPRMTNEINGVLECSATISCPEIARLILGSRERLTFEEEEGEVPGRNIISISLETRSTGIIPSIQHLLELRNFTINVLQQREFLLSERIVFLGLFFRQIQSDMDTNKGKGVAEVIHRFQRKLNEGKLKKEIGNGEINRTLQFEVLMKISEQLNDSREIDSMEYLSFMREFKEGVGAGKEKQHKAERYEFAYANFYEPFMKNREDMLENYLVNYVFQSLFPACESINTFEAYEKLVHRYSLIQFYLVGIAGYRKGLEERTVIEFIQVFSKALEHNYQYFEKFSQYMNKATNKY